MKKGYDFPPLKILSVKPPKIDSSEEAEEWKDWTKIVYLSGTSCIEKNVEINLLTLRGFVGWKPSR